MLLPQTQMYSAFLVKKVHSILTKPICTDGTFETSRSEVHTSFLQPTLMQHFLSFQSKKLIELFCFIFDASFHMYSRIQVENKMQTTLRHQPNMSSESPFATKCLKQPRHFQVPTYPSNDNNTSKKKKCLSFFN